MLLMSSLRRCCVSFKAQTSSTPLVRFRHGPLKKGICDDAGTATACDALLTHKLSEIKSYRKFFYIFICVAGSVSETRSFSVCGIPSDTFYCSVR